MGDVLRFAVRVKPGARGASVGGTWGDGDALIVSVQARATDGKANRAVIKTLAAVLNLKKWQLRIVGGESHRTKLIEVVGPAPGTAALLATLRAKT